MKDENKYNEELEALIEDYGLSSDHKTVGDREVSWEEPPTCPLDEIYNLIEDYFMGEVSEDDYEISPIAVMPIDELTNAFKKVATDICQKLGESYNYFEYEDDVYFYDKTVWGCDNEEGWYRM